MNKIGGWERKGWPATPGVDDLVVCVGDFNGHMGRHVDGFDGVKG